MSKTKLDDETKTLVRDRARDRKMRIRCAHCHRVVDRGGYEIDHIIPEIASTPELRKDADNLQVLCSRKNDHPLGPGCHQIKTAREAREAARRNRGSIPWAKVLTLSGLGVTGLGYSYTSLFMPGTENIWLGSCAVAYVIALSTILVKNGFDSRRPQENLSADSDSRESAETVDKVRAAAAAREVMGQKGNVKVTSTSLSEMEIYYGGTGFDDSSEKEGRADLIGKINAKMGGRWRAEWDTRHDLVKFMLRPDLPPKIDHPGFPEGAARPWHILPVAPGVHFDLLKTSHLLIIGRTGAGKTALMRGLACAVCDSASRGEVDSVFADPKMIELLGFEGWPGVREVVTDDIALWDMALDLEADMRQRFAMAKAKTKPLSAWPKRIVVIDEYEQYFKRMRRLWQNGNPNHQGPKTEDPYRKSSGQVVPPPIDAIQSVLSMARRAGIHLIIGTQSPDATWFGGTGTRENVEGRAAVGQIDGVRAKMMFNDSSIGRDVPIDVKGRATIQMLDREPEEHQVYWVPDPGDMDGKNTPEDWALLQKIGMPKELIPL